MAENALNETITWGTKQKSLNATMGQLPGDNSHAIPKSFGDALGQKGTKKRASKPEKLNRALGQ